MMNRFVFALVAITLMFFGVGLFAYTIKECGWKALFLGDGAFFAAATGMCEK